MSFDFKKVINRENTDAVKWDYREQMFGRNDVLPMWVADMDFFTIPQLKEKIINRAEHNLYGYNAANDQIYQSIINWLIERHQFDVEKSLISFSPGVIPSLYALVQAFTKPNDQIVIQPPVYPPFFTVVKAHGRELVENPLIYKNNRYTIDFDHLESCFKNGAKAFILCSPHNPVGRVWTKDELERLAELCVKYNVYVFSDEIHSDIIFSNSKHTSIANINNDIRELTFTLMAPSKTFNVAGLQASFAIAPNKNAKKQFDNQLLKQGFISLNTFAYIALETCYKYGSDWLNGLLDQLEKNRNHMITVVENSQKPIKVIPSEGTYLMWLDFSETGLSHDEIKRKLIDDAKVGLNDGLTFGKQGEKFMRINIGCPPKILDEGIKRILNAF